MNGVRYRLTLTACIEVCNFDPVHTPDTVEEDVVMVEWPGGTPSAVERLLDLMEGMRSKFIETAQADGLEVTRTKRQESFWVKPK